MPRRIRSLTRTQSADRASRDRCEVQNARRTITSNGELELYHRLWEESLDDHELIPTRGCSVPTFHGSAEDLAAVAATLVSLLGDHLRQTATALSGTHLI